MNGFHSHSIVKVISFDQTSRKSHDLKQYALEVQFSYMLATKHGLQWLAFCRSRGSIQCCVQFVPGQNKNFMKSLEISAVTSHTAGKNQKNHENILIQFSVMYLDSGCSSTLANCHFVKVFTSYELTRNSVVEVNRSPFLLKHEQ